LNNIDAWIGKSLYPKYDKEILRKLLKSRKDQSKEEGKKDDPLRVG
jgi:hypothetical protein